MRSIPFETTGGTELELHGEYDSGNSRVVGRDMYATVDAVKFDDLGDRDDWTLWFKLHDHIVFSCQIPTDDVRTVNFLFQTIDTLDVNVADPLP